jgi:streptogramin lyase
VTEYELPFGRTPIGITTGPDGNLWFTEQKYFGFGIGRIARINPKTDALTEFALPDGGGPQSITVGPDGNIWFTETADAGWSGHDVGRITPDGVFTFFDLPQGLGGGARDIITGPDGNLWFGGAGFIGQMTPAGITRAFNLPSGGRALGLAFDSKGSLWFTEWDTNSVGRLTPDGAVTELPLPPGSPGSMVLAPDGSIQFVGEFYIGRLTDPPLPPVAATEGSPFTASLGSFTDPTLSEPAITIPAPAGGTITIPGDPVDSGVTSDFSATINWGDSSTSTGTIVFDPTSYLGTGYYVNGSHTYAEAGHYAITILVQDVGGSTVTLHADANIADAPLSASAVNVQATAGAPFEGLVAHFTDANPLATVADLSATIAWGDGTTSAATLSVNSSGGFDVTGEHTYAAAGVYTVNVQISDSEGSTTTVSPTATVINLGIGIQLGQTVGIGFWHNKNGQALIDSFNGGPNSTTLANWLAATLPNLYGSLAGETNAQVAGYYLAQFNGPGPKLAAQVLDTALDLYATTLSLGGTAAQSYGFLVTSDGLGAASVNVGSSGAAFDVANGSVLNVYQILRAVDRHFLDGSFYRGDDALENEALAVFAAVN